MPLIDDPRYTESAIIGPVRQELMSGPEPLNAPGPSLLDTLAAASRSSTLAGAAYARFINADPDLPDAPPGYDALDHIQGYEAFAHHFVDAATPSEVAGIKGRIDAERADRETLTRAGLGGPAATITLNLLDPSFLAATAVPELALAKSARVSGALNAAFKGAAGASAYETGMQSLQTDRTAWESGLNIGAGALLAGVLGHISARVPKPEFDATRELVRSEAGAAAVARPTTLAEESLARGGATFSKIAGAVPFAKTDLQVVMESDSILARQTLQELADVTPILEKNTEASGFTATPTSVESLVARQEGRVADFAEVLDQAYTVHRANPEPVLVGTPALSKADFRAAVAGAARRGDDGMFPAVTKAARFLRAHVFDPLKLEAQRLGLLPQNVEVVGAESYFTRMYDREAIRASRRAWDEILVNHFMHGGGSRVEAVAAAESVTRSILGADVGQANFGVRAMVPTAGPLRERVLTVPDALIEKFLVNDPLKVANAYVRELAPQIEITRRFGDKDMLDAFDKIRAEYDILRERVRSGSIDASGKLSKLEGQEKATLEALTRVRDRIYGRAGRLSPDASEGTRTAVTVARGWRNLVASARLGMTALITAPQDTARVMVQYGFGRTMARLTHLVASPAFRALSKGQARHVGAAVEVALARRVSLAFDGAVTEGWTQSLANGLYKLSGLNHWTDFARTLSASLLEDNILKTAAELSAGRMIAKFTRTQLASLGLDGDALRRIHAEALSHGRTFEGVRMSGSGNWQDAELAARYDAAILKESRVTVMQGGAADRTWWMDSETGRVIGQLKSFTIATPMRMAITPFQMMGQRRYLAAARFVGFMMAGGYLSHVFRQLGSGRLPTTDPVAAAGEAFTESGLGGMLPDLVSPLGRRFGLFGESARFSDRNVLSTFGGPALGTVGDAYDFAFNRTANGMSARDLQLLRRLLPYQNLWWMRRGINALEGEAAEAMGLQGADAQTFGERVLETKPLLSTTQRGGTGTGAYVQ